MKLLRILIILHLFTPFSLKSDVTSSTGDSNSGQVTIVDESLLDGSNRLRVSTSTTLFEANNTYGIDGLQWATRSTGDGYQSWQESTGGVITIGVSASGTSLLQSRKRIYCPPGRSITIKSTVKLGAVGTVRAGLFEGQSNGVGFQSVDGVISVFKYSSLMPLDNRLISQDNWNLDKLDGTGPSGKSVDFQTGATFVVNFQWGGYSTIRYGVVIDGKTIYCHALKATDLIGSSVMRSANLPVAFYASGASSSVKIAGVSVQMEGSVAGIVGKPGQVDSLTHKAIGGSWTKILAVKVKNTHRFTTLNNLKIYSISESGKTTFLKVMYVSDEDSSFTWYDTGSPSVSVAYPTGTATQGTQLFAMEGGPLKTIPMGNVSLGFSADVANTPDCLLIYAKTYPFAGDDTVIIGVTWEEFN